jgi:hypothetical protein
MVLLTLTEDRATGRQVWIVEFDGVLAGRFDTKDEVAAYLRIVGLRLDPDRPWRRHQLM